MDVLNEQQLHAVVVDPAITRLNNETIPAAQHALDIVVADAVAQLSTVVQKAVEVLDATVTTTVGDLHDLVNSLDGWTLDITIPPITLRLSKPKTQ